MRSFADLDALIGLVPAHIVTRLSAIDFGRGSEALYRDQMPGLLTDLANRARVQSITASSAIEGVIVAGADRAQRIINRRTSTLRNRSEQELAGYRDAQDYLFQQDWRPLNVLEQLRNEGKVRADGTGRSATWTRMTNTASSE